MIYGRSRTRRHKALSQLAQRAPFAGEKDRRLKKTMIVM